jgi:histidyl-tRNA synthetase
LSEAPKIGDSLCNACLEHFGEVKRLLAAFGVQYELVPTLVRGLDYYTRTVFEFVNDALDAAESTICAGGRYDYLVEEIGGQPTPGVGWASGLERVAMSASLEALPWGVDVFFVCEEGADRAAMLAALMKLRSWGVSADADYAGRSRKGQFTQAKRLHARKTITVKADTDLDRVLKELNPY